MRRVAASLRVRSRRGGLQYESLAVAAVREARPGKREHRVLVALVVPDLQRHRTVSRAGDYQVVVVPVGTAGSTVGAPGLAAALTDERPVALAQAFQCHDLIDRRARAQIKRRP